jgi:class 3 adenylate cyclase
MKCPRCEADNRPGAKFCDECGYQFAGDIQKSGHTPKFESERKPVTTMFSDLSGYTAMTEKLDPEEVKEIMSEIFGEITKVIFKYEGFVEKFIGDAVMAVFGVPKAHEDDPIRAIKAAMEIHTSVEGFSPRLQDKIGRSLTMHTGINTGLVITGEVNVEKGTHGLTGDAINLASRIEGLSKAGEILVGQETYNQAEGFFNFEPKDPVKVKGKSEQVYIYKVLSQKEKPIIIHRPLTGLRADLIGREKEMAVLSKGVQDLKQRNGSIISIYGEAGTGKSRLTRDFEANLDLNEVQWYEGHAYGYTQNTPYYPLRTSWRRAAWTSTTHSSKTCFNTSNTF